jgi:hypothetical protein
MPETTAEPASRAVPADPAYSPQNPYAKKAAMKALASNAGVRMTRVWRRDGQRTAALVTTWSNSGASRQNVRSC